MDSYQQHIEERKAAAGTVGTLAAAQCSAIENANLPSRKPGYSNFGLQGNIDNPVVGALALAALGAQLLANRKSANIQSVPGPGLAELKAAGFDCSDLPAEAARLKNSILSPEDLGKGFEKENAPAWRSDLANALAERRAAASAAAPASEPARPAP